MLSLLLAAAPAFGQTWADDPLCEQVGAQVPAEPTEQTRALMLNGLGIEVKIPDNFRAILKPRNAVQVVAPESYDFLACLTANRIGTAPDVTAILFRQTERQSAQQLRAQAAQRSSRIKRVLAEATVAGQSATVYVQRGMYDDLVVRVPYPDGAGDLLITTPMTVDGEPRFEAMLENVLASLRFL